jgi:hypothetical protein
MSLQFRHIACTGYSTAPHMLLRYLPVRLVVKSVVFEATINRNEKLFCGASGIGLPSSAETDYQTAIGIFQHDR